MRAIMQLVALDAHTEEDPDVILNAVDLAIKEILSDPDNTPERELRVLTKCHEMLSILHARFTPVEYRLLLE